MERRCMSRSHLSSVSVASHRQATLLFLGEKGYIMIWHGGFGFGANSWEHKSTLRGPPECISFPDVPRVMTKSTMNYVLFILAGAKQTLLSFGDGSVLRVDAAVIN